MTHLLLIRHGETEWNAAGRIQGHSNSALSPLGRRQAEAVAARLSQTPIGAIYSSDLSRALDTAAPLAAPHDLTVRPVPGLREKGYGDWEGMTEAEVIATSPDGWHRYHVRREINYPIPGGETWEDVRTRIVAVLHKILADHRGPDETVALVGHGASLRPAVLDALDAPLETLLRLRLDNASLTRLEYQPERGGRVIFLNDTSHLAGLAL